MFWESEVIIARLAGSQCRDDPPQATANLGSFQLAGPTVLFTRKRQLDRPIAINSKVRGHEARLPGPRTGVDPQDQGTRFVYHLKSFAVSPRFVFMSR